MTLQRISLVGIGLLALAVGYLLVPRDNERVAILMRDGNLVAASAELQRLYDGGDPRQWVAVQLALVHQQTGNNAAALALLETFVSDHPSDVFALAALANIARIANRGDTWLAVQRQLVAIEPTPERVGDLLRRLRFSSPVEAELDVLSRPDLRPRLEPADLIRLSNLLIVSGRRDEAIAVLMRPELSGPAGQSKPRTMLFCLLLEANRVDEAEAYATQWLNGRPDETLAVDLVRRAADLGAPALATRLVERVGARWPKTEFDILGMLATEGHRDVARAVVARIGARKSMPDRDQLRTYVSASRTLGGASGPYTLLATFSSLPTLYGQAAEIAELIGNEYGLAALAPVRALLNDEILSKSPLLGAELYRQDGNLVRARSFLEAIEPSKLAPNQQSHWLALSKELESPQSTFATLFALQQATRVNPELKHAYLDLAIRLGHIDHYQAAVRELTKPTD